MLKTLKKAGVITATTGLAAFAVLAVPYSTANAWTSDPVEIRTVVNSTITIGGNNGGATDINIDGTPDEDTGEGGGTGSHTIDVSTNDPNGLTLSLSMTTNTNNSLNGPGSAVISAIGTPGALTANTWGYSLNGTTFNAVPLLNAPVQIGETNAAGPLNLPVTYGIETDSTLPEGTYSNFVQYTAVAKP